MKKTNLVTGILLVAILFGSTAQAALRTWIAQSGDFNNSANWDTGTPVNGDDTQFTNDTAYTVGFTGPSAVIASNLFNGQGGAVTLSLGSQTLVVTNAFSVGDSASTVASVVQNGGTLIVTNVMVVGATTNGLFIVGNSGVGTYWLTNGTAITTRVLIGNATGTRGTFTVSGSGVFTNQADALGTNETFQLSSGFLNVTNGGQLFAGPVNMTSTGRPPGNAVLVAGAGSVWDMESNNFTHGFATGVPTNDTFVVASGGMVTDVVNFAFAANGNAASNTMIINSGGSVFVGGALTVGAGAATVDNSLIVTNGGMLMTWGTNVSSSSDLGRISIGSTSGASNNSIIVTGAGSVWDGGSNDVRVGGDQVGTINNTSNNLLWVTAGGVMTNVGSILLGDRASAPYGNKVLVDNGGQLLADNGIRISTGGQGTNNTVQIGGASAPALLTCNRVQVGGSADAFGCSLLLTNGSTLIENFGTTGSGNNSGVGDASRCVSNTMIVTGLGTLWNGGSNTFEVGFGSSTGFQTNNLLLIKDHAIATNLTGMIVADQATASFGNSIVLTNHAQLFMAPGPAGLFRIGVAAGAVSNSAVIVDGSAFNNLGNVTVGYGAASTGSVLQVGGPGAPVSFNVSSNVYIGGSPPTSAGSYGNLMTVSNAVLNTGTLIVGNNTATTNNLVTVANATWNMTTNALRAIGGEGNTMVIGASAVVTNVTMLDWGDTTNSIANTLIVTNGGQLFTGAPAPVPNTNNYYCIGVNGGTSNTVIITGLGSVWDAGGTNVAIGQNVGTGIMSSNNTLYVSASGVVTNLKLLEVGPNAGSNSLAISGGAVVTTSLQVFTNNVISFTAGTLETGGTLVQSNLYTGSAFVVGDGAHAATLQLAGGGAGYHEFDSGLVIANGATLTGAGTILTNGNVTVQGTLAPNLTIVISNNLTLVSGSTLSYQLGNPQLSLTTVGGQLTLAGTVNATAGAGFAAPDNYVLFTYGTLVNPTGLTPGTMPAGYSAVVSNDVANSRILLVVSVANSDPFTTWQSHYFTGSPLNSSPNADPLGKGMSNTNQFLAGFNPTNAAAYLHVITIAKTNNNADIRVTYLGANGDSTWSPGVASRTNVLEFTTGTGNGSYSNNFASTGQTNILSGGTGFGVVTNMVDSGGATNKPSRYYRVRVLLP